MSFRVTSVLRVVAVVVVSAGVLAGGGSAQADEVWYQSYQRSGSEEVCAAQPGETPWQASWGPDASWHPSWEMWANGGRGGWTCGRAITWARDPVASTSYSIGDIGPGGGTVFYDAGAVQSWGRYLEAAPSTWSGGADDPIMAWCSDTTNSVSTATAIGTGAANTTSMLTSATPFVACTSGAGFSARNYGGGGLNDWFLPSLAELNALDVSRVGGLTTFGFYWSSSQADATTARSQDVGRGGGGAQQGTGFKTFFYLVRPVRAF